LAARRLAAVGRRRADTLCSDLPGYAGPATHQLDGLDGRWLTGQVRGRLVDEGWAASLGYPALVLDPEGAAIDVFVLESADLEAHWSRLDEFEGPAYQRVTTVVHTAGGDLAASIYVRSPG
jgi:gamma-glutamylcyclotransferase (GGCT)/AIG2-like uncharacterized protein YtfP